MTSHRDITSTAAAGLVLLVLGVLVSCGIAYCLTGCPSVTPTPAPVTPPGPGPVDPPPAPDPDPAATPCERACANADRHHCDSGGPLCVRACERDEELGGEFTRHPDCQSRSSGPDACAAIEACRGGQ
jgi:hypothetical protein